MEALFLKLVNMSITASWLVLAILSVRLLFQKTPKWILCLLWGLVAFRLICPFSIESSLSLIPDTAPVFQDMVYTSEIAEPAREDIPDLEGKIIAEPHPPAARGESLNSDGNVIPEKTHAVTSYPEEPPARTWISFLSKIWIAGICGMLIYIAASYRLLKRKVATAIPVKKGIKQSEYVDSPFVLGILRPVIYLPFGMDEGDMAYVIAHEKAHICRKDHWWKPLGFLLLSIYWFNPVLWAAYVLLCRDIEAACDEKVIRDMDQDDRRAYSTALLNYSVHRRRIATCPLAFGEIGIKERVKWVMNYKKPAFWIILVALIVCVIIAVCFLTNPVSALPTIDSVSTWFDMYSQNFDEQNPKSTQIDLPGLEGASLLYENSENEIQLVTADGSEPIIRSDLLIRNVFLTDLNGDGVSEVCATVQAACGMLVQVYDPIAGKLFELPGGEGWYYVLSQKADRLCVLKYEDSITVTEYAQVALTSDGLELRKIDAALKALTERVLCVDIWAGKMVCLSSDEKLHKILNLLRDLKNNVQPASAEELVAVREDDFYIQTIVVTYALGQTTISFSENFDYVWEYGADAGYRVNHPEPLRQFVGSVTNGVREQDVSGQPFAGADAPWDWCAGINTDAVESAQIHVCLNTYSYGNTSGSSATNGWISYDTLEDLIRILNQIPKDAFTPDKTLFRESYHGFFVNQHVENSSLSVIDGVNDIAVAIHCENGKVTMLLTGEMENVRENNHTYLAPTQVWAVEDPALTEFMDAAARNPPVIHYSVGAEYEWQPPITIEKDHFVLKLRLFEGWEYEYVTNPTDSGIRCRPEGTTDGWIYFSYWPEEYTPVEKDRYISEGRYGDWMTYTSYAAEDVNDSGGLSFYGAAWSYKRYDLDQGDYVIINDGADAWFAEYKDRIQDILTLSTITVE